MRRTLACYLAIKDIKLSNRASLPGNRDKVASRPSPAKQTRLSDDQSLSLFSLREIASWVCIISFEFIRFFQPVRNSGCSQVSASVIFRIEELIFRFRLVCSRGDNDAR